MGVKKKPLKAKKITFLEKDLIKNKCYAHVLSGTLLAIDPSIGSKASMPGYALFHAGELIECGTFDLPRTLGKHKRLYELGRILREEFDEMPPDVLAVERIVARPFKGGAHMNATSLASLHKAVGVVMGSIPVDHLVEVATSAWMPYIPDDLQEKSDMRDAVSIGLCVIGKSKKLAGK